MEKACIKCGEYQTLDKYYAHPQMKDGKLGRCKECVKASARKRHRDIIKDPVWAEKERTRSRKKYHRLGYKGMNKPTRERKKIINNRHRLAYPEKYKAKNACNRHVKLIDKANERHHWSYNEEHYTDIIELSVTDHNKLHRHLVYEQKYKMYRRFDNYVLLNTKEAHIEYFNEIMRKDKNN